MGMLELLANSPATLSGAATSGAASFFNLRWPQRRCYCRPGACLHCWPGLVWTALVQKFKLVHGPLALGIVGYMCRAWRDASPGCSQARRHAPHDSQGMGAVHELEYLHLSYPTGLQRCLIVETIPLELHCAQSPHR